MNYKELYQKAGDSAACRVLLRLFHFFGSQLAIATSDPLTSIIATPGGAGIGFATRMENSPYRGGGTRNDLVPVYLYEGSYAYLHAYRAGLKLYDGEAKETLNNLPRKKTRRAVFWIFV